MRLSVVIPIYNVEKYLCRCLDSILQNTSRDFEVLMIDDGTKDDSGIVADKYAKKYGNFYVYHKTNGGLSDARNYGLDRAQGDYIWFVDSDDYIVPGAIDVFLEYSEKKDVDVFCFTIEKHTDTDSQEISYTYSKEAQNGVSFLKNQYRHGTFHPEAWRNIYRRSLLVENDLRFEKGLLHEDDEWTPRVLVKASSIIVLKYTAYVYVIRNNSIMRQKSFDRHIESLKFMIEKYDKKDLGFDSELKVLVLDRMINNYISTFAKGHFWNEPKYFLPYSYFKGKIAFPWTRIKVLIFCLNKRLFCLISSFLNKESQT